MRLHCINFAPAPVAVLVDDKTGEVSHVALAMTNDAVLRAVAPYVDVPACERLSAEEETQLSKLLVDYEASKDPNRHYDGPNARALEQIGIQRSLFPLMAKKAKQGMCDELAAMKSPATPASADAANTANTTAG